MTILSGNIYGSFRIGALGGRVCESIVKNCYSYANVYCSGRQSNGDNGQAGGLIGYGYLNTVSGCYVKGDIESDNFAGGFIGHLQGGSISSCGFEGAVSNKTNNSLFARINTATSATISDCFAVSNSVLSFSNTSSGVANCLFISNGTKKYIGSDFSNWVITTTQTPLPSGLSWLAYGGEKVNNISQIQGIGFTQA